MVAAFIFKSSAVRLGDARPSLPPPGLAMVGVRMVTDLEFGRLSNELLMYVPIKGRE